MVQVGIGEQIVREPTLGVGVNRFLQNPLGSGVILFFQPRPAKQSQRCAIVRTKLIGGSQVSRSLVMVILLKIQIAQQEIEFGAGRRCVVSLGKVSLRILEMVRLQCGNAMLHFLPGFGGESTIIDVEIDCGRIPVQHDFKLLERCIGVVHLLMLAQISDGTDLDVVVTEWNVGESTLRVALCCRPKHSLIFNIHHFEQRLPVERRRQLFSKHFEDGNASTRIGLVDDVGLYIQGAGIAIRIWILGEGVCCE